MMTRAVEEREHSAIAGAVTPGAIRYEWELSKQQIGELDRKVRISAVGADFKRAWLAYLIEWKRAYAASLSPSTEPTFAAWRRARAYRSRTAAWVQALARQRSGTRRQSAVDDVGALIVTPGAIKDELETVNAGVRQLDAEINGSNVRGAFKNTWRMFAGEWAQFYKSKQGFWGRTWGSTMTKALEYKKRVDEWRSAYIREGGQSAGPTLNVPRPPADRDGGVKWWLVGGLLAGGAIVGVKVLR